MVTDPLEEGPREVALGAIKAGVGVRSGIASELMTGLPVLLGTMVTVLSGYHCLF